MDSVFNLGRDLCHGFDTFQEHNLLPSLVFSNKLATLDEQLGGLNTRGMQMRYAYEWILMMD
jgi:hypothetical protein